MSTNLRLLACTLLASAFCTAATAETFSFWPGKGASSAPGFKSMDDHPCGEVATAEVSKIPTAKNSPLDPELVVELNARGKIIRRWSTPVDTYPRALRGEELLIYLDGKGGYWIRPDGSFAKATSLPPDRSEQTTCDLKSVFGDSGSAQCETFVDLTSGKKRTLGYQGVCS